MAAVIDLNCDLGEGGDADAELMPLISSVNIACGAHAGDPATMRATVQAALRHGVAIGAHPGFADRAAFGRRELALTPAEIVSLVQAQIEALCAVATREGARVTHSWCNHSSKITRRASSCRPNPLHKLPMFSWLIK